jgi:hypothetical protein
MDMKDPSRFQITQIFKPMKNTSGKGSAKTKACKKGEAEARKVLQSKGSTFLWGGTECFSRNGGGS